MRSLRIAILAAVLSLLRLPCLGAPDDGPRGTGAQANYASVSGAGLGTVESSTSSSLAVSTGMVPLQVRKAMWGGPLAHKWVQIGTGENAVTIGYGAANFPLVDSGQVVVTDRQSVELVSRWHLFRGHITPAEKPGRGYPVGHPVYVTVAQAQKLIQRQRRHRMVFPYIPLFHDCHTYACELMSAAEGKSSLPCYLLFKGHF